MTGYVMILFFHFASGTQSVTFAPVYPTIRECEIQRVHTPKSKQLFGESRSVDVTSICMEANWREKGGAIQTLSNSSN